MGADHVGIDRDSAAENLDRILRAAGLGERDGEAFRASGSKFYSTGSLYADWVSAVALDEDDRPVSFVVPRDREGLELLDDFDAMGQRLTASGTTRLNDLLVQPGEIRPRVVEEG